MGQRFPVLPISCIIGILQCNRASKNECNLSVLVSLGITTLPNYVPWGLVLDLTVIWLTQTFLKIFPFKYWRLRSLKVLRKKIVMVKFQAPLQGKSLHFLGFKLSTYVIKEFVNWLHRRITWWAFKAINSWSPSQTYQIRIIENNHGR